MSGYCDRCGQTGPCDCYSNEVTEHRYGRFEAINGAIANELIDKVKNLEAENARLREALDYIKYKAEKMHTDSTLNYERRNAIIIKAKKALEEAE